MLVTWFFWLHGRLVGEARSAKNSPSMSRVVSVFKVSVQCMKLSMQAMDSNRGDYK